MSTDHNPNLSQGELNLVEELQKSCRLPFDINNPNATVSEDDYKTAMRKITKYLEAKQKEFVGYQLNQDIHVKDFEKFLELHINNIGDTYSEANLRVSNKGMERAVVRFYSHLWNAPRPASESENIKDDAPVDGNEAWGHILTMGCTEGNMYALRNARDYLKGKYSVPDFDHRGGHTADVSEPREFHPKTRIRNAGGIRLNDEAYGNVQKKCKSYNHAQHGEIPSFKNDHDKGGEFLFHHDVNETLQLQPHDASERETPIDREIGKRTRQGSIRKAMARRPGRRLEEHRPKEPILIYTDSSHYSIGKIKDLLELHSPRDIAEIHGFHINGELLPEKIPVHPDGSMDHEVLLQVVKVLVEHDYPYILATNYGTTFTGGHDAPIVIYNKLKEHNLIRVNRWIQDEPAAGFHHKDGGVVPVSAVFVRPNFWIHVDGALGGAYGSLFCSEDQATRERWANEFGIPIENIPALPCMDFRHNNDNIEFGPIMSIAMSGHKLLGSPMPTGIVMSLKKYILDFNVVSYVGSADTTMAGSRNGLSAMVMWNQIAKSSVTGYAKRYIDAESVAAYACEQLRKVCPHVYRAPFALSVIFVRPDPTIIVKYSLSTDRYQFDGMREMCDVAHIFCMPQVTREKIDQLCADLKLGVIDETLELD